MRVGIIGIGNICKKAYLPIITAIEDLELVLCTRNENTRKEISKKYRIEEAVSTVDELIKKNVDCAFVHSSTKTHYSLCKTLLENGIHVYVDKPLSYNLDESLELLSIAKKNNRILKVGFNRRNAPMIHDLKNMGNADIIIMQKNRVSASLNPRVFLYDDFIHVLDTIRFLMGNDYKNIRVDALKDEKKLKNIVVTLSNSTTTAIAIMNRDNGTNEENIEIMVSGKKAVVKSLTQTTFYENNLTTIKDFGDWENTLYKRGFTSIIESFIEEVASGTISYDSLEDAIKSHKLCEEILELL
ncbi:Gfo/Idh/MocA family protein [Clostridium gasigenes]|uniref:Gfo/Idh/MocA family protein n=1 Tax=Clostridium gasigenes TaxID=94869 RepID=UPI001C0D3FBF|nr:Gfo/Idh/MocA family oxidoreductase [Clostridium gasigenes]MBU3105465.1 Gfo/Idh/MocA family oxidoreductase [Clostridium gasigenes]